MILYKLIIYIEADIKDLNKEINKNQTGLWLLGSVLLGDCWEISQNPYGIEWFSNFKWQWLNLYETFDFECQSLALIAKLVKT